MGAQTGVYPRVSPGGWHLIGSTSVVLFDAGGTDPSTMRNLCALAISHIAMRLFCDSCAVIGPVLCAM